MIEINLVPESLRKRKRAVATPQATTSSSLGLSKESFVGILSGFVVLLVLASLGLQGYTTMLVLKRNGLKKHSEEMAPGKTNVEKVKKNMETLKARVKTLEDVLGKNRIVFAQKLNHISDHLPRSIWLTKVAYENKFFIVEGSAVSKLHTEINDIHAFAAKLREIPTFMDNLKSIDVEMIKTKQVESLSVADFTIKAEQTK